ncbi:MAG TPA: hypothetical protein PLV92_19525, partial [Pirellulaceae bacterium]|nr:hypothetical protein [Pirellulaceae bacterium]
MNRRKMSSCQFSPTNSLPEVRRRRAIASDADSRRSALARLVRALSKAALFGGVLTSTVVGPLMGPLATRPGAGPFAALSLLEPRSAGAVEPDSLRQKQQAQEKARQLARELVSGVLDIQLRQLAENGMEKQPVYRDIKDMQKNLDVIAKDKMDEVVQLLVKAQEGSQKERVENFNQARDKIRDVVVHLMSERQKLQRRLQVARVSAQVQQLIGMESKVLQTTRGLPEETADRRDTAQLNTIQDQHDVSALYLQLVTTLQDLSTWSGEIAAGASDGLRILKAAQVETELKTSIAKLKDTDFDAAQKNEQAVIKGLKSL